MDYGIYKDPEGSKTFTVDSIVHLGMEDADDATFSLEKKVFKAEYEDHDLDNKTPTEDDLNGGGVWDKCPDVLDTELDVEDIWEQVKGQVTVMISSVLLPLYSPHSDY